MNPLKKLDEVKKIRNSDVTRKWNAIVRSVGEDNEVIVVELRGVPTVAFVPYELREKFQEFKLTPQAVQPGEG